MADVNEILAELYKLSLRRSWFDFDAFIRANADERLETLGHAVQAGKITPNEARILEGLR